MCLLCGGMAAALERTAQPDAMEWLWLWCKPIGYRQHGLGRQRCSGIGAASSLLLCPHRPPMSVSQSGCFAFACARADCLHAQVLPTRCHSSCMCVRAYCLLLMRAADVLPMQPHVPTAFCSRELPKYCQCSRTRARAQQAHHASRGTAEADVPALLCGGMAAALERTAQPDAMEWLWC